MLATFARRSHAGLPPPRANVTPVGQSAFSVNSSAIIFRSLLISRLRFIKPGIARPDDSFHSLFRKNRLIYRKMSSQRGG